MTTQGPPVQMHPVDMEVLKTSLSLEFPYLKLILYRLKPVQSDDITTFAVDADWNLYYGKRVPFNATEQVAVLYHEVNHVLRKHNERRNNRHAKAWNMAADLEINDDFPRKLKPPDNILYPRKYDLPEGKLSEWYYDRINRNEIHVREDATATDPGKGPCATDKNCDSKDRAPKKDDTGKVLKHGLVHAPVCGGATGNPSEDEKRHRGQGTDAPSDVEKEAVRRQTAENIEQMGRGNAPAGLQRWAKELLHPEIRWEKLLKTMTRRATIEIAGQTDQTYAKPARRDYGNFILPRRYAHKTTASLYIDTSGSINQKQLEVAITEVRGAIKSNAAEFFVSFCDTEVANTRKVLTTGEMVKLQPKGGGGTDMRQCFEHAKTLRPKVNLVIIITDGMTPWPSDPNPGTQTIVVWTKPESYTEWMGTVPPWAKVVKVGARQGE